MPPLQLRFQNAQIGPPDSPIFRDFSWSVEPGQSWVVTGANGSGKSSLAQALAGALPVRSPSVSSALQTELPEAQSVALLSFERQRDVVFDERYHDDSEFAEGGLDPGTSARDFIVGRARARAGTARAVPAMSDESERRLAELVTRLGITALLDRGLKYLSTGEIRKVLLCRELLRRPALLIFDEPYQGLDAGTRVVLEEEIERLVEASVAGSEAADAAPTQVLVITDRYDHVPRSSTHVLHLEACRAVFSGSRAAFEAQGRPSELAALGDDEAALLEGALARALGANPAQPVNPAEPELVRLRDVTVSYHESRVLSRVNLTIRRGQHTLVRGPNGCGKTTLLNLINGDNPQAYSNDVTICGMKRGSGESIWDVKAKLGQVSYALHVEYAYRCTANLIETVISGFHDSIGLYREPGFAEIRAAERWLGVVGLIEKRAVPFIQLSYGEQRAALILRAVVKEPPLLILDEPCHGLDTRHRSQVLTIADYIGKNTDSTLLYVTHDPEEELTCTRQRFELDPARGWVLTAVTA